MTRRPPVFDRTTSAGGQPFIQKPLVRMSTTRSSRRRRRGRRKRFGMPPTKLVAAAEIWLQGRLHDFAFHRRQPQYREMASGHCEAIEIEILSKQIALPRL